MWTHGGPGRKDAWVRRVRCCPGNGRDSQDRRPDRAPGDEEWDARGPPRPVTVDGNGASAVDPWTTGADSTPRRRTRSAPATVVGNRRRRIATRWFLRGPIKALGQVQGGFSRSSGTFFFFFLFFFFDIHADMYTYVQMVVTVSPWLCTMGVQLEFLHLFLFFLHFLLFAFRS